INEHAMGVVVELSLEAKDDRVRLAAATWLHQESGKQIAERERLEKFEQQRAPRRESQEEIIAGVRMLYAKALQGGGAAAVGGGGAGRGGRGVGRTMVARGREEFGEGGGAARRATFNLRRKPLGVFRLFSRLALGPSSLTAGSPATRSQRLPPS